MDFVRKPWSAQLSSPVENGARVRLTVQVTRDPVFALGDGEEGVVGPVDRGRLPHPPHGLLVVGDARLGVVLLANVELPVQKCGEGYSVDRIVGLGDFGAVLRL